MAYAGMLALDGEERPVRAEIEFSDDELLISVASGPLGAWPLGRCRIEPDGDRFLLDVDGDLAWFRPEEPAGFARDALEHRHGGALASAVKTARVAGTAQAPVPSLEAPPVPTVDTDEPPTLGSWWSSLGDGAKNMMLAGMAVVVGALVLVSLLGAPATPPVASPTSLITTTAPTPAFQLDLEEVSMRWNEVAAELRVDMFIPVVPTDNRMEVPLGSGIVLYATEDPRTGRVRTMMLAAGPGEGDQAQAVLAAWGTLIALVNPDLSPEERRAVLGRLGVDVERPLQLGLNTETEQDGIKFWLRSGVLDDRVLLGVELET